MAKLYIIKIGGNIIDDEKKLSSFLKDFSGIEGNKILVHGGGKLATKMAEQMNIPQQVIDGRQDYRCRNIEDCNDGVCRLHQ